jgi:hypothetical protein
LPTEGVPASEALRIEELEEDGRSPFLRFLGAAVPGQARGERLDEERERETLVPQVDSPKRQDRARPLAEEHGGVVAGPAVGVDDPASREAPPGSKTRRAIAFVVVLMLTSRSTGSPSVGKPAATGFGVSRAATPPWGATPVAEGSEQVRRMTKPSSATGLR